MKSEIKGWYIVSDKDTLFVNGQIGIGDNIYSNYTIETFDNEDNYNRRLSELKTIDKSIIHK